MKMKVLVLPIAGLCLFLCGCQNPDGTQNNTGSGALIGGAVGAVTGAAIGGRHHGGPDALIGAAAGVVAGGLIGYTMDREQEARLRAKAPATYVHVDQGQPLSVADVKALAKAGVSEEVIISQINNSHTVFHLSAADMIDLRDAGVPDGVVTCMINTAGGVSTAPAPTPVPQPMVVAQAPPPPQVETAVVAPGPGYVWVGGEWAWEGRWVWVGGHWVLPPRPHAVWVVGLSWHDAYGWHHVHGYWG